MGDFSFDKNGRLTKSEPIPLWQTILLFLSGISIGLFLGSLLI